MAPGSIEGVGGGSIGRGELGFADRGEPEKICLDLGGLKTILKLGMDSRRPAVLLEFIAFGRSSPALLSEATRQQGGKAARRQGAPTRKGARRQRERDSQEARHNPTTLT